MVFGGFDLSITFTIQFFVSVHLSCGCPLGRGVVLAANAARNAPGFFKNILGVCLPIGIFLNLTVYSALSNL